MLPKIIFIFSLMVLLAPAGIRAKVILPSHAFQEITWVLQDIQDIRQEKRVNTAIQAVSRDPLQTPTTVYHRVYVLADKLKQLSKLPEYTILEPVALPEKTAGRKIPEDVVVCLKHVRRASQSIRRAAGVKEKPLRLPEDAGKTPPDVYRLVERSIALVDTLLE
jgi:hypothetical protein